MVSLLKFRRKLNKTDNKICSLLEKRFKIVEKIRQYKKENNLPIEDKKREKEIIDNKCKKTRLSKDFTKKLFKLIFKESKKIQK